MKLCKNGQCGAFIIIEMCHLNEILQLDLIPSVREQGALDILKLLHIQV